MEKKRIMILGVGNLLLSDEGVGVRVVERLTDQYEFPENVSLVDGGLSGICLLGRISHADRLIVLDAVRAGGKPGTLYRLEGEEIPRRFSAKNSLHGFDLLEALTLCQALDKLPETVILGVEPGDISTPGPELTPPVIEKMDDLVAMVLEELTRLGLSWRTKRSVFACA